MAGRPAEAARRSSSKVCDDTDDQEVLDTVGSARAPHDKVALL
ncbi:hypothetical protein [Streptomyces sp. NPDC001933]